MQRPLVWRNGTPEAGRQLEVKGWAPLGRDPGSQDESPCLLHTAGRLSTLLLAGNILAVPKRLSSERLRWITVSTEDNGFRNAEHAFTVLSVIPAHTHSLVCRGAACTCRAQGGR